MEISGLQSRNSLLGKFPLRDTDLMLESSTAFGALFLCWYNLLGFFVLKKKKKEN